MIKGDCEYFIFDNYAFLSSKKITLFIIEME